MQRYVIVVLIVFLLAAASTGASGQLIPTSSGQSFGRLSNSQKGTLSLYGGWVTDARTFNYETTRPDTGFFSVSIAEYDYDYSSFLLGAEVPISLGDYGVLSLSASWLPTGD